MVEINIRDKNFGGEPSSCHKGTNKHVKWCFENKLVSTSCFITDLCLDDIHKASAVKRKIAWILEPRVIHPHVYDWIEQNNKLFDYVLTFDTYLLDKGENYLYYPHGRCWINKYKGTKKENKTSIIASSKNSVEGHKLRHEVIRQFKGNMDVYGHGYNSIEDKEEALLKYKFSVTIENCRQPGYWTEKIVDAFATKSIPIFWGHNAVNDFFDPDGIIYFDNIEELKEIFKDIEKNGDEIYESKKTAIEYNFKKVEEYRIPEDWCYLNYPFLFN